MMSKENWLPCTQQGNEKMLSWKKTYCGDENFRIYQSVDSEAKRYKNITIVNVKIYIFDNDIWF